MIRWLGIALLVAGCASVREGPSRAPAEATPPDEAELARAHDDLRRLDTDLRAAEAQAPAPDCTRVEQLRDNICALATRICQIAERQPLWSSAAERCADGKARCKDAVERTQARGCPKK